MSRIKQIIIFSICFVALNITNTVGQDKNIEKIPPAQKIIDNRLDIIENQLKPINTSLDTISHELNKTRSDLNANLVSEISSVNKQIESTEDKISGLSQEFNAFKMHISDMLITTPSPDYTQIGMFWFSLVLVLITIVATHINYRLYRLQTDPDVIVYVVPDPNRSTIINLIIENIGKGVAKNIKFTSDRPIPCRAFGMDDRSPVPKEMDSGPLITGIPDLGPSSKRVITWGQYHGLLKGLGDEVLTITVDYSAPKGFIKAPNFEATFSLDIKSFEGTDASDQNWDKKSAESLINIAESVKKIASSIKGYA